MLTLIRVGKENCVAIDASIKIPGLKVIWIVSTVHDYHYLNLNKQPQLN